MSKSSCCPSWSSSRAGTRHCSLHRLFLHATALFPRGGVTIACTVLYIAASVKRGAGGRRSDRFCTLHLHHNARARRTPIGGASRLFVAEATEVRLCFQLLSITPGRAFVFVAAAPASYRHQSIEQVTPICTELKLHATSSPSRSAVPVPFCIVNTPPPPPK